MSDLTIIDLTPALPEVIAAPSAAPGVVSIIAGPKGEHGDTAGPPVECAVAVAAGQPIVVGFDGRARLARADDVLTWTVAGLAQASADPGHTTVPTHGFVRLADWTAAAGVPVLTPGGTYWLSPDVEGRLTPTAPVATGTACVRVGLAVAPDTLDVSISSIQL